MKLIQIDDTRQRIEEQTTPEECWLWCDVCHRFFQYERALPSALYSHDNCPFEDCYGMGVGFNIYWWDDMREPDDPRWPSSIDQLRHGMPSPDMAPFYAAKRGAQIEATLRQFTASREWAAAGGAEHPPRYVASFLQMMSDLAWQLLGDDAVRIFEPELARIIIGDLPDWCEASEIDEAEAITTELGAFFTFATRTAIVPCAAQWNHFVQTDPLTQIFRDTIRARQRRRPAPTSIEPTARAHDRTAGARTRKKRCRGRGRGRR